MSAWNVTAIRPGVLLCLGVSLLMSLPRSADAQPASAAVGIDYMKRLTIEELATIDVTSAARREQPYWTTAAGVYIITEEDIRRSGARSIPEALRLAPSLQVARATSRSWAISARGFAAPFSNKLLVLIDGRSVYSPLFSGVFWDAQDTLLQDVERIEVINGPGGSVWGANAVNGIINIITKDARDSAGALVSITAGNEERLQASTRYGGTLGGTAAYRIYAKYFGRGPSALSDGDTAGDAWRSGQIGGRSDWRPSVRDRLTVQGDIYRVGGDVPETADIRLSGGNLLGRWTRTFDRAAALQVQAYYDRTHQFVPTEFGDTQQTVDVDLQYERPVATGSRLMVGGGYRYTHDVVDNLPGSIAFLPDALDRQILNAFVQNETTMWMDRIRVTLGSKFERNDYTGWEIQPTARLAITGGRHVVWGALSRAVRTPSRFDRHLFFPATPPFTFAGGPQFDSEVLIAPEIGWKVASQTALVSVAAFFNRYDDIRSTTTAPPFITGNDVEGSIHGIEMTATWQPAAGWRLTSGYTLLREDIRVQSGGRDLNGGRGEAFDPEHQIQARSSVQLGPRVEFDVLGRYVGEVSGGRGFETVPDYLAVDVRLGVSVRRNLELAVVAQNPFDDRHREFGLRQFRSAAHVTATWRLP